MTASIKDGQQRTYGQWRLGRSAGLFGLGTTGTVVALGIMAAAVAMLAVSTLAAVWTLAAGLVVLGPLMIRINGRTGLQVVAARIAWWMATARRHHVYVSGIASQVTGIHQLPGILARSSVYEVETGRYGQLGVVVIPQSRHYTISMRAETEGTDLVDQDVIDARVARLAAWLAALSREPMLVQAAITVESSPDPGTRLAQEVSSTMSPDAPQLAQQVLDQVVRSYPAGSASVVTRVTVTFTPPAGRRMTHEEMCREVAARLPHLHASLIGTGVTAVALMTAADLAAAVRSAYDPAAAQDIAASRDHGLDWANAGPVAVREYWDHMRHDSGVSRTWGMAEAPRGAVFATTFSRLAEPDPELLRKSVTILYRPYSAADSAKLVERDKRDAVFNASKKARPTSRDMVDVAAAEQAAAEEARGASLVRFTVLVTATVADESQLREADSIIKARAGEARMVLRPMNGSQSAAFAAGLPAGVVLPVHASIPF